MGKYQYSFGCWGAGQCLMAMVWGVLESWEGYVAMLTDPSKGIWQSPSRPNSCNTSQV